MRLRLTGTHPLTVVGLHPTARTGTRRAGGGGGSLSGVSRCPQPHPAGG